jgi:hypothetical protein
MVMRRETRKRLRLRLRVCIYNKGRWGDTIMGRETEREMIEHAMGKVRGGRGCDRGAERQRDNARKLLRVRVQIYIYIYIFI